MSAKNSAALNNAVVPDITQRIRQHQQKKQQKRQQAEEAKRAREEKMEFFNQCLEKAQGKLRTLIQKGFIDLDVVRLNPIVTPAFVESCPELKHHQEENKVKYARVFDVKELPYHTVSYHGDSSLLIGINSFDPLNLFDSDWFWHTYAARTRPEYSESIGLSEETLCYLQNDPNKEIVVYSACLNPRIFHPQTIWWNSNRNIKDFVFHQQCKLVSKRFLRKALALNMFDADPKFFDQCWKEHLVEQERQRKQTAQLVMQQRLQTNNDLPEHITSFL